MKSLVDTYGWVEWFANGPQANLYAPFLSDPSQLIVPTLLQYELYKWVCRERTSTLALEIIGITEQGTVVPLDTSIALQAAEFGKQYNLAMADAIIYATSRKFDVLLISSDAHFKNLPHVKFFSK